MTYHQTKSGWIDFFNDISLSLFITRHLPFYTKFATYIETLLISFDITIHLCKLLIDYDEFTRGYKNKTIVVSLIMVCISTVA